MRYPALTCKLCVLYHRCRRQERDKALCVEFHPCHCRQKMTRVGIGLIRIGGELREGRLFRCELCEYELRMNYPPN